MLDVLALVALLQHSPPPPTHLDALGRSASHIVIVRITAFHDIQDEPGGLAMSPVIEANVARTLKGPPLGSRIFLPFDMWWRPDITSSRVGDEGIAFLKASNQFPLTRHARSRLRLTRGSAPAIPGALGPWGYVPIVDGRAVAAGSIILPMPAELWTPGDVNGPSVVDLIQLTREIEQLAK